MYGSKYHKFKPVETKGYFIYEAGKYRRKPKIINFNLLFMFFAYN